LSPRVQIRPATPDDVGTVLLLIKQLAEYERAAEHVRGTAELLTDGLFGPQANAEAVVAELDARPVGFAVFFHTFSTWECRRGLWLEDLFVLPEHRRAGVGRALLSHLAAIALERGCARFEWAALEWNTPALEFYAALGAETMDQWRILRVEGEALSQLGTKSDLAR
jgi:GNAT superfamily N-acetyltransferase